MRPETLSVILQRVLLAAVASGGAALSSCARIVIPSDGSPVDTGPPDSRDCTPSTRTTDPCSVQVTYPCNPPPGVVPGVSISSAVCASACPPRSPGGPFCSAYAADAGAVVLNCSYCAIGRRTEGLAPPDVHAGDGAIGDYLANHAMLEAASVEAFERLGNVLRGFGAPESLLAAIGCAADDERAHATLVESQAVRFGGTRRTPVIAPTAARNAFDIARENAVEGCVRETFGALIAMWQATHAPDPQLAAMYSRLADDETRHGALSLELESWLDRRLDERERRAVRAAKTAAVAELRREVMSGSDERLAAALGIPSSTEAMRLFDGLADAIWKSAVLETTPAVI